MMMGTPARPGMTISKPPPAKAADVIAIKIASATPARIAWSSVFLAPNLTEARTPRVKAGGQTAGKPNAQAFALVQLRANAISNC